MSSVSLVKTEQDKRVRTSYVSAYVYAYVERVTAENVQNKTNKRVRTSYVYAYVYAYVERVTGENRTRQIRGFVLPMFMLMFMLMSSASLVKTEQDK